MHILTEFLKICSINRRGERKHLSDEENDSEKDLQMLQGLWRLYWVVAFIKLCIGFLSK